MGKATTEPARRHIIVNPARAAADSASFPAAIVPPEPAPKRTRQMSRARSLSLSTANPATGESIGSRAHGRAAIRPVRTKAQTVPCLDSANPMATARAFQAQLATRLVHHSGVWMRWDGACYREQPAIELRAELYHFLEKCEVQNTEDQYVPFAPNRRKVADVVEALAALVTLPGTTRAPAWIGEEDHPEFDPFDLISFSNGLLHAPTGTLLDPTPDFYTTTALPFDYDKNAPKPVNWLRFVKALWPADQESRDTLQEWTGLLLTSITRYQKILLMVGPPRSGKGAWSRVVRQLVGAQNYAALTFHSLGGPFGTQVLIGKTVAIISDARLSNRADAVTVAERLLAISGEDSPSIQRKQLPDYQGLLAARFTLLTNELPELTDASRSLSSRFLVLKLTESWLGKEDLELESRFVPELPGIIRWALVGLHRLQDRGRFVQPESARDLIEQVAELASPITTFVVECCALGKRYEVERQALYRAWCGWCERGGHKPGNKATFGRNLRAAYPSLGNGYKGKSRLYRGIRIVYQLAKVELRTQPQAVARRPWPDRRQPESRKPRRHK